MSQVTSSVQRRVFIAYAQDAESFAHELAGRLRAADIAVVLDDGERAAAEVHDAVRRCQLLLFVISADAVEHGAHTLTVLDWAVSARRRLLGIHADGHDHVIPPPEVAAAPRVRGGTRTSVGDAVAEVRGQLGVGMRPRLGVALGLFAVAAAGGAAGYHLWGDGGPAAVAPAPAPEPAVYLDAALPALDGGGPLVDVQMGDAGRPVGVWIGDEYSPIVAWTHINEREGVGGGPGGGLTGAGVGPGGGGPGGTAPLRARPRLRRLPDGGLTDAALPDGAMGDGGVGLGGYDPGPCPVDSRKALKEVLQLAVNYCLPSEHRATIVASIVAGQLTVGIARSDIVDPNIHCVRTVVKRAYRGRGEMFLTPVSWLACERMTVAVTGYR